MSKLATGQMASPSPRRTVGVGVGDEEAGKRALSHAAQRSESRLAAGSVTDRCLDPSQPWKWLESKPMTGKKLHMCILDRSVC